MLIQQSNKCLKCDVAVQMETKTVAGEICFRLHCGCGCSPEYRKSIKQAYEDRQMVYKELGDKDACR